MSGLKAGKVQLNRRNKDMSDLGQVFTKGNVAQYMVSLFGVPQKRERMIIIGTQVSDFDFDELWEETKQDILRDYPHYFDFVTVEDAIGNLGATTTDGNIENPTPTTEYQRYLSSAGGGFHWRFYDELY